MEASVGVEADVGVEAGVSVGAGVGVGVGPAAGWLVRAAVAVVLVGLAAVESIAAPEAAVAGGAPAAVPARTGWSWPLTPRPAVVRPFAPGPGPYSPGHLGVDLAAGPRAPVLAAAAGRVSYAGLVAGRGVVVVATGVLLSTYEPVRAQVTVGQQVDRGDVLGALEPGHPCGRPACLHWGVRRDGAYLDPLSLVRAPVRLLPVDPADEASPAGRLAADSAATRLGARSVPAPGAAGPPPPRSPRSASGSGRRAAVAALGLVSGLLMLLRRPL